MKTEEAEKICEEAAERVGEHFDSVLVLASWTCGDKETELAFGLSGNFFTCKGMAHDFLETASHEDLASKLADAIADKEGYDDSDD